MKPLGALNRVCAWIGGASAQRQRAEGATTNHLRELVDGLEMAIARRDELELARFLAPRALGQVIAESHHLQDRDVQWLPARTGLRWSSSPRESSNPGCFWLRIQFEDATRWRTRQGWVVAPMVSAELELELDTRRTPWKLCRVLRTAKA